MNGTTWRATRGGGGGGGWDTPYNGLYGKALPIRVSSEIGKGRDFTS